MLYKSNGKVQYVEVEGEWMEVHNLHQEITLRGITQVGEWMYFHTDEVDVTSALWYFLDTLEMEERVKKVKDLIDEELSYWDDDVITVHDKPLTMQELVYG